MTLFTVSPARLDEFGGTSIGSLKLSSALSSYKLTAVSSVLFPSVDVPRFHAVLDTVRASRDAYVPHMIMLDNSSHPAAGEMLRAAGAIVIELDHETEGGLARPFVIAAQLISAFATPETLMVKFEGEKPLFAEGRNVQMLIDAGKRFDIITGERTLSTWESMPPYQAVTEALLGVVIGAILGVSHDTPSGVIALNSIGRNVFIETTRQNSWPYLFETPYIGRGEHAARIGAVPVAFDYHPAVVEEETGNPVFDEKRRKQIDTMVEAAVKVVGGETEIPPTALARLRALQVQRVALERLAALKG